jgi:hypothetical protein
LNGARGVDLRVGVAVDVVGGRAWGRGACGGLADRLGSRLRGNLSLRRPGVVGYLRWRRSRQRVRVGSLFAWGDYGVDGVSYDGLGVGQRGAVPARAREVMRFLGGVDLLDSVVGHGRSGAL